MKVVWCCVLTWWTFCSLQLTISESLYFIFDVVVFKGMMLWRAQLAGLSVVDVIVDCGMILLFCAGYGGERLAAMLTFGSCIMFVLPVDVSSLVKISAGAVAK